MAATLHGSVPHDETRVVTIMYVDPPSALGWWRIHDSLKRQFMTKSDLVASLAEQYRVKQWACRPVSVPHWPDREIIGVARVDCDVA